MEDKEKEQQQEESKELDLDQLDELSGGSIKNVRKEKTTAITDDVANRI